MIEVEKMLLELIEGSFLGGDDCGCDGATECREKGGGCECRGQDLCGGNINPCDGAILCVFVV